MMISRFADMIGAPTKTFLLHAFDQ